MGEVATGPGWELRLGRWQDVLRDVACGSIITDPPYSARTHAGQYKERADGSYTTTLEYSSLSPDDVDSLVTWCAAAAGNWVCAMTDHVLAVAYESAGKECGLTTFPPVPCIVPGMTVRMAGDGPSSWTTYMMVSRTKAAFRWGTLPGWYTGPQGERLMPGSKSLVLMRAIVRDYSRPGDLVCDPYAGSGTTLLAAVIEGRRAIGAEMDRGRFDMAVRRLREGHTVNMFHDEVSDGIHD